MSDVADYLIAAGIGFLLGFKVAARMGERQIERVKRIWAENTK